MRKRHSVITSLLVSLLLLLTTGQGLASGFVLCIGADGHSAFEESFAGKCAPPAPVAPACPTEDECSCAACDDHCGPCHDIATSLDSLQARSRLDHDGPLVATSLLPPLPSSPATPVFIRELTANLQPQPPPRPALTLASLRTVVLRN